MVEGCGCRRAAHSMMSRKQRVRGGPEVAEGPFQQVTFPTSSHQTPAPSSTFSYGFTTDECGAPLSGHLPGATLST